MKLNEQIICKDGFAMSAQANHGAYCVPRVDDAPRYTQVEVGYPSHPEPLLLEWAENKDKPTDTVYPYVPVHQISLVCVKHGGIISGGLPTGIAVIEANNASR